ncbi:hypothetical protein SH139x_003243 [Planctomycetaceae bacterium SH139]
MSVRSRSNIEKAGKGKPVATAGKESPAFTLLETILSLALISLLMVGVTTGIALYAQYQGRGVIGVRDAKILAGTIADIRDDLRACYPSDQTSVPTAEAPRNPFETSLTPRNESKRQSNFNEKVLFFEQTDGEEIIHFVGRPEAMMFRRHGGNQRFAGEGFESDSAVQLVVWVSPSLERIRLPQTFSKQRMTECLVRTPTNRSGLWRAVRTLPSFPTTGLLRLSREDLIAQSDWLCNDRIAAASFRYFDSQQWLVEWDSHLRDGEIPAAVELTIVLATRPDRTDRVTIRLRDAG